MTETLQVKMCPHCERELPLSGFYKSAQTQDGLFGWCKRCVKDKNRKQYASLCSGSKMVVAEKACVTCDVVKPASEFGSRKETRDGLRCYCKACGVKMDRKHNLQKSFGITLDQYEEMFVRQNGVCAICQQPQKGKSLAVDHCHVTEKVRGLLCDQCNRSLGGFGDSIDRLKAAIAYLEKMM